MEMFFLPLAQTLPHLVKRINKGRKVRISILDALNEYYKPICGSLVKSVKNSKRRVQHYYLSEDS
jgi:hypothetical protein